MSHFTLLNNIAETNRAVYEIMWENTVEPGRPQMTIWRMRIACWIPKDTDAHSEYAIFLAFQLHASRNVSQCYVTRTLTALFKYADTLRTEWNKNSGTGTV